jgi:hypothetical protein
VRRAEAAGTELLADAFVSSDTIDGSEPWRPGAVTMYFGRLRSRSGLEHLNFHSLRNFSGKLAETDRAPRRGRVGPSGRPAAPMTAPIP